MIHVRHTIRVSVSEKGLEYKFTKGVHQKLVSQSEEETDIGSQ